MPHAVVPAGARRTKVQVVERSHYEEHRRRHLERLADYDATWERPTPDTAQKVYDLVRECVPALDAIHPEPVTAMQLITVTLDVAVISARYGYRQERRYDSAAEQLRHVKRSVTRNMLSDAVMRRWSDHARLARQDGRAYALTQMTEATAKNAWRDLLVNDIYLPVLWKLITGHTAGQRHPLFRAWPSHRSDVEGYDIKLHRGPKLKAFERLVRNDPNYKYSRVHHAWRLWIVGKKRPRVDFHSPICAEGKYNEVTIGDETKAVLKIQEDARLLFDAPLFVADYERVSTARKILRFTIQAWSGQPGAFVAKLPSRLLDDEQKLLRKRKTKMDVFLLEFRSIYEQARPLKTPVVVRSAFYKVLNRRFQNAHFFPMQTSAKKDQPLPERLDFGRMAQEELAREVPGWDWGKSKFKPHPSSRFWEMVGFSRSRWFSAPGPNARPLVSMDVSASQTQIQAVLLGIEDMEHDSILLRRPHKEALAKRVWAAHETDIAAGKGPLLVGYDGPTDKRLSELVKNLWMLLGYGPPIVKILLDQEKNADLYGFGWRKRPDGKRDVRAIDAFLHDIPGYDARWIFLESCKKAGLDLVKTNAYAGATLIDPLDQATFEWDRPLHAAVPLRLYGWDLTLIKPGTYRTFIKPGRYENDRCPKVKADGKRCGAFGKLRGERWKCRNRECRHVWPATFHPSSPDANGNLRVDDSKLKRMIAPCIIHMLDSLFSAFVMKALVAEGVTNFVGIHDCWYIASTICRPKCEPELGHVVLDRAIKAAGEPWLRALGPVYRWLLANVGGSQIVEAHRKWEARVERGDRGDPSAWPYFFAVPSGSVNPTQSHDIG
jgi:hypothetical protein